MEFLNRTKKAILQAAGIASPHVKPDTRLVAAENKLTRLSTLVSHLEKGFQKYASNVRSMAESGTLVAQDVQQFYQNASERSSLAESYCDSHLSIESVASELFSAQFAELFDEFVSWRTEIERTLRELSEASDMRRDAVVLASQLRQMKDNKDGGGHGDDSRRRKVSQFLSNMGKKAPRSEAEAQEMIAQVQRDCERMGKMYREKRAQLERGVEKLIKSRMTRFDQLWVKIMEYQMTFFRSGAAFTEGFQKHIDEVGDSLEGADTPAGLRRVQTSDLDAAAVDVDKDEEKDERPAADLSSDDEVPHKVRSKSRGAKPQQRVASPKKNGRLSAQGEDPPPRQGDADSFLDPVGAMDPPTPVAVPAPRKPRAERQESSNDLLAGFFDSSPPPNQTSSAAAAGAAQSSPPSQGSSTSTLDDIFGGGGSSSSNWNNSTDNILESHTMSTSDDPVIDLDIPTNNRNRDPLAGIFGPPSDSIGGDIFEFGPQSMTSSSSSGSLSRAKASATLGAHDMFDPLEPLDTGSPKTMPSRRKNLAPKSAPHVPNENRRRKEGKSQTLKLGKRQPSRSRSPNAAPRTQDQYVKDRVKEGQQAAAADLKAKRAAEEKLQDDKEQLENSGLGERLERWEFGNSHGNRRQLKTLIGDMPKVLWPEAKAKWEAKNISASKLLSMTNKNELKKIYFKAANIVHPDKVPKNDAATLLISNRVFTALNSAWTEFNQKH